MKMTDSFLAQLDPEMTRTRRAIERVPEGRDDWKPHDKSMALGRLAMLVARLPSWFHLIIDQDELDLNPPGGSNFDQRPLRTNRELLDAFDQSVAQARDSFSKTTDDRLMKEWRLLVSGNVVSAQPKHVVVRDTFMHLAHHRGQLTVYLRMNGAQVPAIYGPSADDQTFQ
jgi:hypothetical protein